MFDSVVAMTDIVMNFWSLGLRGGDIGPLISHGFWAGDGWITIQVGSASTSSPPSSSCSVTRSGSADERFATRQGWVDHLDDELRPAVASLVRRDDPPGSVPPVGRGGDRRRARASPTRSWCVDPHLRARGMVVEIPRTDGVDQPVLLPGNPLHLLGTDEPAHGRVPTLGQHTAEVLRAELDLDDASLSELEAEGVIGARDA